MKRLVDPFFLSLALGAGRSATGLCRVRIGGERSSPGCSTNRGNRSEWMYRVSCLLFRTGLCAPVGLQRRAARIWAGVVAQHLDDCHESRVHVRSRRAPRAVGETVTANLAIKLSRVADKPCAQEARLFRNESYAGHVRLDNLRSGRQRLHSPASRPFPLRARRCRAPNRFLQNSQSTAAENRSSAAGLVGPSSRRRTSHIS
jgi:hypothetical protein